MLIGTLSKQTELSKDTIRYYEKKGLLSVDKSASPFNNYKQYTEAHLQRLLFIKKAKRFGFTLKEIKSVLQLMDNNQANCQTLQGKLSAKIAEIDHKIQELKNQKSFIQDNLAAALPHCGSIISERNCHQLN